MAKRLTGTQRLNQQPVSKSVVLSTDKGSYAADWDDPKVQLDRVVKRSDQPRRMEIGPGGIKRGKQK